MNSKALVYGIAFILQLLPIAPAAAQNTEGGIRLGNMEQAAAPDEARSLAAMHLFSGLAHVAVQMYGYDGAVETLTYNYQVEETEARKLIDFLLAAQATHSAGVDAMSLTHCRAYDGSLPGMNFETALGAYRANMKSLNDFGIQHYAGVLNGVRREFDRDLVGRIEAEIDRRLVTLEYGDLVGAPEDLQTLVDHVTERCAAIRARNGQ